MARAFLAGKGGGSDKNAVQRTGDTMEGVLIADSVSTADLTMAQVRNIYAGTVDMEDGVSKLKPGELYLVFGEGV